MIAAPGQVGQLRHAAPGRIEHPIVSGVATVDGKPARARMAKRPLGLPKSGYLIIEQRQFTA
jgi:hypothetical protein